jgi:uncharacterized protein (TIGR03382 family)
MNAVDDFGFTSLPEPGLAPAAMAGAILLVQLRRRRSRKAEADGSRGD